MQLFRWKVFSQAPHRMFFWAGMLYGTLAMALWGVWLFTGDVSWAFRPGAVHGIMMLFGFFPMGFLGFLLTVFPRWYMTHEVPRQQYIALWLCHTLGAFAFALGAVVYAPLALASMGLLLASLGIALVIFLGVLRRTHITPRHHGMYIVLAFGAGMSALAVCSWGLYAGAYPMFGVGRILGLYGFLTLVVLVVAQRMVPFFTQGAVPGYEPRRSPYFLPLAALLLAGHVLLEILGSLAVGYADLALAALLLWELMRWRIWRIRRPALVVVLYLALGWVDLAFALSAAGNLYAVWHGLASSPLGLGPLHALVVGGFGTLLLGMATRVTLGHSGKGIQAAGTREAALFYGFQSVPLLRVLPEVLAPWWPEALPWLNWAAVGWFLCFGLWWLWFGDLLTQPRVDE